MHRVHPVSSCFAICDHLTRPLCSSSITEPSLLLRVGPPQCSASVLSPRGFGRLSFSLISERLVPAVPCHRQHPLHALSTPVAICSVTRHPADSSQERTTPPVLTTLEFLTTRHRKVHFRSSLGCTPAQVFPALFLQRTLPTALDRSSLEVV
jgi:hypothetical protein